MEQNNWYDFVIFNLGYSNEEFAEEEFDKPRATQRSFGGYKIAKYLRDRGFRIKCVDYLFDFSLEEFDKILDKAVSEHTLGICFSLMFGNLFIEENENNFVRYVERASLRGKKIILGGKTRKRLTQIVKLRKLSDYIIYNEAERMMYKLATDLKNGKVDINLRLKKEFSALDFFPNTPEDEKELSLDFTKDDDLFFNEPVTIELARGCIFNCSFCTYPNRGKSKSEVMANTTKLKEMLLKNFNDFGITDYYIADSTFNDSTEKMAAVASVVAELPFKPRFAGYLRPELLMRYPEQIEHLRRMNFCAGFFGVETLHPDAQRSIGKRFTFDELMKLFQDLKAVIPNFHTHCSMIVGLPYETEDEFKVNITKLILHNAVDFVKLHPLSLAMTNDTEFQSKFGEDQEKYGYLLSGIKSGVNTDFTWTNSTNGMDFQRAIFLADKYFAISQQFRSNRYPVSSFYIWHDQFFKKHPNFIEDYKAKVFNNLTP